MFTVTASSARAGCIIISNAIVRTEIPSRYPFIENRLMPRSFVINARTLEFKLELQIGAIFLEVCKVQRPWIVDRVTGDLRH
jgi:hypothetical protein